MKLKKKCYECKELKLDFNKDLFNREMPVCDKCDLKIRMEIGYQLREKKWIDVKESMPKEFLTVLVWVAASEEPITAYYDGKSWIYIHDELGVKIYDEVLYWFSFPVPPGHAYCDGCNVNIVKEINLDNLCERCEDHYKYKNMD